MEEQVQRGAHDLEERTAERDEALLEVEQAAEALEAARLATESLEKHLKASVDEVEAQMRAQEVQHREVQEAQNAALQESQEALNAEQLALSELRQEAATTAETLEGVIADLRGSNAALDKQLQETKSWSIEAEQSIAELEETLREKEKSLEAHAQAAEARSRRGAHSGRGDRQEGCRNGRLGC